MFFGKAKLLDTFIKPNIVQSYVVIYVVNCGLPSVKFFLSILQTTGHAWINYTECKTGWSNDIFHYVINNNTNDNCY